MMEFTINENTILAIHKDCSVTLQYTTIDDELEGVDLDVIELPPDDARKVAQILTEELG